MGCITDCYGTVFFSVGVQPISEILQKYTKASYNIKGQQLVVKLQSGEYYSTAERLFFVKVLEDT